MAPADTPTEGAADQPQSPPPPPPAPPAPEEPKAPELPAEVTDEALEVPTVVDAETAIMRDAPASPLADGAKDWSSAIVIVGPGQVAQKEKRPVIVCELRDDAGKLVEPTVYIADADLYYRTDPAIDFGEVNGPIVTLGQDVLQLGMWGMTGDPRYVCVGPASPAYGAANLAYARGAKAVEIRGLTAAQKAQLEPWFAKVKTDPRVPADIEITLK